MRHMSLILALALLGGLLVFSQALAAEQTQQGDTLKIAALTGEELRQFNLAQGRVETQGRMYAQQQQETQLLAEEQTRMMKCLLNRLGYGVNSIGSDVIDQETTAAIQRFQKDEGLAVTGMPNQETLRALAPSRVQHEFFGLSPEFGEPISK